MIIRELKRKAKGPLGILRKSIAGRSHDAMKAQDNNKSQQQVGRILELNKRAPDFCFDKFIARFIVKFFFLFSKKKGHTYLKFT